MKQDWGTWGPYLKGISMADSQNIVIMDGDLHHPPEVLPDFTHAFQRGFDIIVGTRYLNGRYMGDRKRRRGLISRCAECILKVAVAPSRRIGDPLSGFIGFKKVITIPVQAEMKGNKLLHFCLWPIEMQR